MSDAIIQSFHLQRPWPDECHKKCVSNVSSHCLWQMKRAIRKRIQLQKGSDVSAHSRGGDIAIHHSECALFPSVISLRTVQSVVLNSISV